MSSENVSGADNQQGRPKNLISPDYIVGFVDGEGCFSVSIRPHPTVRYGRRCIIGAVFQIYQHHDNLEVLEEIKDSFGCGRITSKGPNSSVMTFAVSKRADLEEKIIPFFERHPLRSKKQHDFLKFREVVLAMQRKDHLTRDGYQRIVRTAFSMNQRGKQRRYKLDEILAGPSETVRRALVLDTGDEIVRTSWRHGESGRNDRSATVSDSGGNRVPKVEGTQVRASWDRCPSQR